VHIDLFVALAGLIVGFAVGLTGMGGGALMTPILVLLFGIAPLAAVSSDLVASLIMKPVGAAVHAGRGTVRWNLAGWLALGSIPSAFLGVVFLKSIGSGSKLQTIVSVALGAVLLVAVAADHAFRRMGLPEGLYPLAHAAQAQVDLAERRTSGKVLLDPRA